MREVACKIGGIFKPGWIMTSQNDDKKQAQSFVTVLWSVLASMFGVQSNRRREEDFAHGKPWHYILVGLLVTVMFILLVWAVVQVVMKVAGV